MKGGRVFNKLISYVEGAAAFQAASGDQQFDNILNYTANPVDQKRGGEKCIAIRTHGVTDLSSATIEMNTVAARNTRCEDPAYHFVLAWPEFERPHPDEIFEAAEHALRSLGLADHQYVLAVHANTDNLHCHAAVNRVNPTTFKSRNVEWAHKTIHLAARQAEIKHGWAHDNGIYIVQIDDQNRKSIVLNPDLDYRVSRRLQSSASILPTWHDPDSLESWLKFKVAKTVMQALPSLTNWNALHDLLAAYAITLTDSGGGGLRLHATSQTTSEVISLPASKGLRILKRGELEERWGKFAHSRLTVSVVPDTLRLTPRSIAGQASSSQNAASDLGADSPDRKPRARDESLRAKRRDQRAAARADLRHRFAQYQRFVREGDVDYFKNKSDLRAELSQSIKRINKDAKALHSACRLAWRANVKGCLLRMAAIDFEMSHQKLEAKTIFQTRMQSLQVTRLPPLTWRKWLYEQANLGDQAALSALRGIVYQAQRDAKRKDKITPLLYEAEPDTPESYTRKFHKAMARLLEEEQKEAAIRSARLDAMRPFETDALLVKHINMQWHVTENGNVAYTHHDGQHLFTDRGNRLTFDRVVVGDDDIRLALAHAQQKFGNQLTLTGDDPVFTARMACLADDMGITILNPDMQQVIASRRRELAMRYAKEQPTPTTLAKATTPEQQEASPQSSGHTGQIDQATNHERLRAMVLAIDPRAEFIIPDSSTSHATYSGPVAAVFTSEEPAQGFAQHLGRSLYALHSTDAPAHHGHANITVQYRDGVAIVTVHAIGKGKDGKIR